MNERANPDAYGVLTEPSTLTIQRFLPGPIERVWAYLTESDLRRRWLASGAMEMKVGAPFELVWRNSELTDPPGHRPEGFGEEHRMQSKITELDPPRKLAFTWGKSGGVTFTLEPRGERVLLTVSTPLGDAPHAALAASGGGHGIEGMRERFAALPLGGSATAGVVGGDFTVTAEARLA